MDWTKLIRRDDVTQLLANATEQAPLKGTRNEKDFMPVVRLTVPMTYCQWLLTELEEDGMAFGLADLGAGCPEMGSVWLPELMALDVKGLRVIQDLTWKADKSLSRYAEIARHNGAIVC